MVFHCAEFDEEETKLLLEGMPSEQIPAGMMTKVKLLGLTDYLKGNAT